MATQSASNVSSLSAGALIQRICTAFRSFPDHRQASNNRRYAIADAAMSAFAVFFTQSPSFLDYQVRMQKRLGRNNAASLFGVHKIPCDNQIRKLLDPVSPATLFPAMAEIGADLYRQGYLEPWRSVGGTLAPWCSTGRIPSVLSTSAASTARTKPARMG